MAGIIVLIVAVDRDEGTIVVFEAETLDGSPCKVAVEHRIAGPIARDLSIGDGPVYAEVEGWQFLG